MVDIYKYNIAYILGYINAYIIYSLSIYCNILKAAIICIFCNILQYIIYVLSIYYSMYANI